MKRKDKFENAMVVAIIALVLITTGMIAIAKLPANNDVPTSTITCSWEPIATPTPKPSETPEPTATPVEYFGPNAKEHEKEIEALARVCDAEASVCDENGRRAVIDTVLNRVASGKFRNTIIEECLSDEFQYSEKDKDEIDKKIFAYAEEELIKWIKGEDLVLPSDYFYFWGNHGMDENGNPTIWRNYFYNDYCLWNTEKHVKTDNAFKFE